MRSAPLLSLLLLPLLGTATLAASPVEERARAELQAQLEELAPPSPALVEIVLEGLGLEGYTLEDADFHLDGTPLAVGKPGSLHAKGAHRLFAAPSVEGPHTLLVRLVFRNTDAPFFSQLAGYRWKLASSVRFEAQRGLKVRVTVRPAFIPEAPDLPQRFTLSHGVGADMVAPLVADLPPPPGSGVVPAAGVAAAPRAQHAVIPPVEAGALRVSARAGRRAVAGTVRLIGPEKRELTLAKGELEGSRVGTAPGRYTVELVAPGYLSQLREVELVAGKETALEFKLARTPNRQMVRVKEGKLELVTPIRFAAGSSLLSAKDKASLLHVVDSLVLHDIRRLRVEGHTDGSEGRGRGRDVAISLARATAVQDLLVKAGVPPDRLEVKSMGATRPLAPNVTARGRQYNRRVELVILGP